MSEQSNEKKERTELKFNEIVRYLVDKKIHSNCTSCGLTDPQWTIQAEDRENGQGIAMTMSISGHNITMSGLPMVPLICQNCGYIKFYSAEMILEWVDKNPM